MIKPSPIRGRDRDLFIYILVYSSLVCEGLPGPAVVSNSLVEKEGEERSGSKSSS